MIKLSNKLTGLCMLLACSSSLASPGQLDGQGCHYNKDNIYHCHKGLKGGNLSLQHKRQKSDSNFKHFIKQQKTEKVVKSDQFNRKEWGYWLDTDSDCQNTRDEILGYFSRIPSVYKTPNKCIIKEGKWLDQYTNLLYRHAHELKVSHIVTIKHASEYGASGWSDSKKAQFYNDPLNLIPTHKEIAGLKGDLSPMEWMPPNSNFHCLYLRQWLKVKSKYALYSSKDESVFIKYRLQQCRGK